MKKIICLLFILLFLPSCVQYVNWFKCTFTGGQRMDICLEDADPYICSMPIYHQLQTVGLFDALWLTRDSISVFAQLRGNKLGLSQKEQECVFQKEFSKIKNKLVFYLLAPKETKRVLIDTDNYSFPWGVYLSINTGATCKDYRPNLIKKVYDWPSEYNFMLSYNYNKFVILNDNYIKYRQVYRVEFNLECINKDIASFLVPEIALVVSSVQYRSCCCTWQLPISTSLSSYVS